jgi:hypothetical protein
MRSAWRFRTDQDIWVLLVGIWMAQGPQPFVCHHEAVQILPATVTGIRGSSRDHAFQDLQQLPPNFQFATVAGSVNGNQDFVGEAPSVSRRGR